jgi:acetoin utilization deacetylase AcuC-like enzyme
LIETCIKPICGAFKPDVLVLQCGVDGLAGDPCKEFNISLKGYGQAVLNILEWCGRAPSDGHNTGEAIVDEAKQIPVLLLGGGGYHTTNAARAWAYFTSIALGRTLDLDQGAIPETCVHWETFYNDNAAGDGLDVVANAARRDENTEEDLSRIEEAFSAYTEALRARTAGS